MRTEQIPLIILSGFLLMTMSCASTSGVSDEGSRSPVVENVHFEQEDHEVTVYYDLSAHPDRSRFYVQLLLELDDGQIFELNSVSVSGDVGTGIEPGRSRKIIWDVLQDFPQGLEREEIRFAVNVREARSVNRNWIYYAAGAVMLGAGLSAAILLGNRGGSDAPLPLPPTRPGY